MGSKSNLSSFTIQLSTSISALFTDPDTSRQVDTKWLKSSNQHLTLAQKFLHFPSPTHVNISLHHFLISLSILAPMSNQPLGFSDSVGDMSPRLNHYLHLHVTVSLGSLAQSAHLSTSAPQLFSAPGLQNLSTFSHLSQILRTGRVAFENLTVIGRMRTPGTSHTDVGIGTVGPRSVD
jgi:hypothetical protein